MVHPSAYDIARISIWGRSIRFSQLRQKKIEIFPDYTSRTYYTAVRNSKKYGIFQGKNGRHFKYKRKDGGGVWGFNKGTC